MNVRSSSVAALVLVSSLVVVGCSHHEPEQQAATPPPTDGETCSIAYDLPGDVDDTVPDQGDLDAYSWQLFLALNAPGVGESVSTTGDNRTLWGGSVSSPITATAPGFSSTDDLLLGVRKGGGLDGPPVSVPAYGEHYYPTECQAIDGYTGYRVLDEMAKVDDGFFEAGKISVPNNRHVDVGLSSDPLVATNGTFVRYEILLSEVTYDTVVANEWYLTSVLQAQTEPLSFPCGLASGGGPTASPANLGVGAITIKNAWMEADGLDASEYHMEDLLVFTNAEQNSTGQATCEKKTMALVGMHIAHKTLSRQSWTWSTFEHENNAPDCTANPQLAQANVPNQACPAPDGNTYNFFPAAADAKYAACNTVPATNGGANTCAEGWCADLPPNGTGGYSMLCRQVPLGGSDSSYATAAAQSAACNQATGSSVWSNYTLVSTQWFNDTSPLACGNAAATVSPSSNTIPTYAPQVALTGTPPAGGPVPPLCAGSDTEHCVPYLANTSMESYERSNCMGCHSKAVVDASNNGSASTDMMYFLMLEVPAAPINQESSSAAAGR